MQAIQYHRYGGPDVLELADIPTPVPALGELLVCVHAASVNPMDWHFLRGEPYLVRLFTGLGRPSFPRLGADFAGVVEAVGLEVTGFRPGDRVYGTARGSFAQYATARPASIAPMPAGLSFMQAAAVPVAALTALQAIRDHGRLQAGQRVLVNGASGGVGSFAVQIARALGASVTAVTSTRNMEWVGALGAERVIDYTSEDFTLTARNFDLLIDTIGNHPLTANLRALSPPGTYVAVGGKSGNWIDPLVGLARTQLTRLFVPQRLCGMLTNANAEDLAFLAGLLDDGRIRPVLDRTYPLAQVQQAVAYLEQGHARGKVAVEIIPEP